MRSIAVPVFLSFVKLRSALPINARTLGVSICRVAVRRLRSEISQQEAKLVLSNDLATVVHLLGVENLDAERDIADDKFGRYYFGTHNSCWNQLSEEARHQYFSKLQLRGGVSFVE